MAGLGLPVAELAERLQCRVTVLGWDPWLRYERLPGSFFEWMPAPNTRLINPGLSRPMVNFHSTRVGYREIPARDPVHNLAFAVGGLSGQSHGLLANSDPLFFLAACLERELAALQSLDPFQAVVVPMASATARHSAGFHPSAEAAIVPSLRRKTNAGNDVSPSALTAARCGSQNTRNCSASGPR